MGSHIRDFVQVLRVGGADPQGAVGNQALAMDPLLVPHRPGCLPTARSRALPAICQLRQRIPVH